MPAKKRKTPRKPRRFSKPEDRAGGENGDTLRTRLRELIQARCNGINAEFARRLRVDSARVTEWLIGVALPGAKTMRAVGDAFGVSIDWLLGFDVPMDRDLRAPIGALSSELRNLLQARAPAGVDLDELQMLASGRRAVTDDAERLVGEVAAAWWSERLRVRKQELAPLLRDLARQIREGMAALPTVDQRGLGRSADDKIPWLFDKAAIMESSATTWAEMPWSSKSAPLSMWAFAFEGYVDADGHTFQRPVGYTEIETPFVGVGESPAFGHALSGSQGDYVWYIDPDARTVAFKGGPGVRFEGVRRQRRIWDGLENQRPEGLEEPVEIGWRRLPRGVEAYWIDAPAELFNDETAENIRTFE